jgi:hypothetical protein
MEYNILCPQKGTPTFKNISNKAKIDTSKSKNLITPTWW